MIVTLYGEDTDVIIESITKEHPEVGVLLCEDQWDDSMEYYVELDVPDTWKEDIRIVQNQLDDPRNPAVRVKCVTPNGQVIINSEDLSGNITTKLMALDKNFQLCQHYLTK